MNIELVPTNKIPEVPVDSYKQVFSDAARILAVFAHPDDMEVVCGGIVAKLTQENKTVRLVVTTNGGKGTRDLLHVSEEEFAQRRTNEQLRGAQTLGIPINQNFNLNIPDGEVEPSLATIEKVVWHIREFKPDIIITHNPEKFMVRNSYGNSWVNHRDHRNTAIATIDAAYPYSRDTNFFPDQFENPTLTPHKVKKLLLSDPHDENTTRYFDISEFADKKRTALDIHSNGLPQKSINKIMNRYTSDKKVYECLSYYEKL